MVKCLIFKVYHALHILKLVEISKLGKLNSKIISASKQISNPKYVYQKLDAIWSLCKN